MIKPKSPLWAAYEILLEAAKRFEEDKAAAAAAVRRADGDQAAAGWNGDQAAGDSKIEKK